MLNFSFDVEQMTTTEVENKRKKTDDDGKEIESLTEGIVEFCNVFSVQ